MSSINPHLTVVEYGRKSHLIVRRNPCPLVGTYHHPPRRQVNQLTSTAGHGSFLGSSKYRARLVPATCLMSSAHFVAALTTLRLSVRVRHSSTRGSQRPSAPSYVPSPPLQLPDSIISNSGYSTDLFISALGTKPLDTTEPSNTNSKSFRIRSGESQNILATRKRRACRVNFLRPETCACAGATKVG
ncbi:jg20511 [Pararge aegeria aegeria]|uniref:Jg20511 protein n=1 Tax=Pararge aegeria aegeria TaxID=348720 RepID=A0A8S4SBE7_9NEOP|nr:jg20511 [Pararge aegeria aegeria]